MYEFHSLFYIKKGGKTMPFTNAQKTAIDLRNSSLLVSAGAGSGKTSVLTERIVNRLCDENDSCNITDFIVVTFTKAAAKEMSDRIRRKLSERASEDISNKKILRNLSLLPLAKICTIDSFCYDLVKNNFQKIGLSASLRMIDEAEAAVVRTRIANEVIDDAFCENDGESSEDFILAYEIFSGAKSDDGFVETLLELENKISLCASVHDFMNSALETYDEVVKEDNFFNTYYGKQLCEYFEKVLDSGTKRLQALYEASLDSGALEKSYSPSIEADIRSFEQIRNSLSDTYENARSAVQNFSKARLGIVKNYENPELQDRIKKTKSEIGDLVTKKMSPMFRADSNTLKLCAYDSARVIRELFRLVMEFSERYTSYKNSLGILDFSDCAHYALELLTDSVHPLVPSELAKSMRRQYKEVYIDEYQDVNELQDMIFLSISGTDENGNENSRFMVGDVKQSIYGFRGARPDIFNSYRNTFDDADTSSSRKRIFMSNNFRCSQSVIDFTNGLFSRLMGDNYAKGDELIYSREEEYKVNAKACLTIFDTTDVTDENCLDKEEIEAVQIAKKILDVVDNPLYLNSKGEKYTFADVAVLTKTKNVHETYERVFSQMGIPVFADAGEKFYSKKEIKLSLCILNSIDNPERDIYVAGFLRSCIAGFTDDELCIIKRGKEKMRLYQALVKYTEENKNSDNELCKKCESFIERLSRYRALSRSVDAAELVWEIYCDTDLLNLCASARFGVKNAEDGENARKNLMKLYNIAANYTKTSFRGIGDFLEYIDGCKSKDDTKADRILAEHCVHIMTVHRSKGLEFPVCFLSDTSRKFFHKDEDASLLFSFSDGVAVRLRDTESIKCQTSGTGNLKIETPFRALLRLRERSTGFEEEMRTLYVALTRAKDLLFITAGVDKGKLQSIVSKAYENSLGADYSSADSYLEAILSCIVQSDVMKNTSELLELDLPLNNDGFSSCLEVETVHLENEEYTEDVSEISQEENEQVKTYETDMALLEKLRKNDEFKYKGEIMTKIPSKLTVSMLKTGLLDDEQTDSDDVRNLRTRPLFISGETKPTGAEKGTAMHMFMQFARYEECENGCQKEADRLQSLGFIDSRQREILDISKLDEFFASDFYKSIKHSANIFRERRFNLLTDASEYTNLVEKGYENVLVQGVIDLYFENDDGTYTVVDFKTDRVSENDGEQVLCERHSAQLKYYCRAVEEITGKPVKNAYLYSFALMREISVEI